jgi:hypothetical protein
MMLRYLSFIDAHCSFYGLTLRFDALVRDATRSYRSDAKGWKMYIKLGFGSPRDVEYCVTMKDYMYYELDYLPNYPSLGLYNLVRQSIKQIRNRPMDPTQTRTTKSNLFKKYRNLHIVMRSKNDLDENRCPRLQWIEITFDHSDVAYSLVAKYVQRVRNRRSAEFMLVFHQSNNSRFLGEPRYGRVHNVTRRMLF